MPAWPKSSHYKVLFFGPVVQHWHIIDNEVTGQILSTFVICHEQIRKDTCTRGICIFLMTRISAVQVKFIILDNLSTEKPLALALHPMTTSNNQPQEI